MQRLWLVRTLRVKMSSVKTPDRVLLSCPGQGHYFTEWLLTECKSDSLVFAVLLM